MEVRKTKPFPWMCMECREKTVTPKVVDYSLPALHDGVTYELTLRQVAVPTCARCGRAVITSDITLQIENELRRAAGLLMPEEIRAKREALGLTRAQLATAMRVDEEALVRWESGMQLQSRAIDLLMRIYFDSDGVRQVCAAQAPPNAPSMSATSLTHG